MSQRLAAILALIVFAACLLAGVQSDNAFTSTVWRALVALFWTYIIGLAIGAMGQRMLDENVKAQEQKLNALAPKVETIETNDR